MALAIVKLLRLLPPAAARAQLPRTLQGVANLLRNRLQRFRRDTNAPAAELYSVSQFPDVSQFAPTLVLHIRGRRMACFQAMCVKLLAARTHAIALLPYFIFRFYCNRILQDPHLKAQIGFAATRQWMDLDQSLIMTRPLR